VEFFHLLTYSCNKLTSGQCQLDLMSIRFNMGGWEE
jgi:hypothetical protein